MSYTCTYSTSWMPNNVLVIMFSIAVIAFVYLASRFLPGSTRMKVTGVIKMELTMPKSPGSELNSFCSCIMKPKKPLPHGMM